MNKWDLANVEWVQRENPVLAEQYRANPNTNRPDGFYPPYDSAEEERYYDQRLAWLRKKLADLDAAQ